MNKKSMLLLGLILAAAIGAFLPQFIVDQVEGSPEEVTYQFTKMGMTTSESREEMKDILENIVGIVNANVHPTADQITVTFDAETMKAEWIAKSLGAHGYAPDSYQKVKNRK